MKRLVWVLVLLAILLACATEEKGSGTCHELWVDCSGIVDDYIVHSFASDLEQRVEGGIRYFSYYDCQVERRSGELFTSAECTVGFKY